MAAKPDDSDDRKITIITTDENGNERKTELPLFSVGDIRLDLEDVFDPSLYTLGEPLDIDIEVSGVFEWDRMPLEWWCLINGRYISLS